MDFMMGLLISVDQKDDSYYSILIIIDRLIKIVNYKPVSITIDASDLAKVIINRVVRYYRVQKSIVIDQDLLFTSKFYCSLCYFLKIRKKLSTAFHLQTDG